MKDRQTIKTTFLLQELRESKSIYSFIQENHELFTNEIFSEYLKKIIFRNKISKADLVKQTGLSKSYAYAILGGSRRPPSRNRVIAIGFAVKANLEELQKLLTYSEYTPLSPKIQRDAAIIFALEQDLNLFQLSDLLFDLELDDLE